MKRLARAIYASVPFKRQLYAFIRHRLNLVPAFYQHLHFTGPFELSLGDERSVRLFSYGHIVENDLFWRGFGAGWEGTSLKLWKRICEGGRGLILDIGANNGIYALVAATVAPSAEVIAFEPIARIARQLRRNVALNRLAIAVEERAVSDKEGTTAIFDVVDGFAYSASLEGLGAGAVPVEVPVCSIDRYLDLRRSEPVIAVKIDVERHEPAAIAGMRQTLVRDRPAILIEILDAAIGSAVADQVRDLGYRMFHIAEGRGLVPTDRLEHLGDHDWNHLLCTEEQFRELGLADFLIKD